VRTGDLTAAGWSSSGGQIGKLRAKHTAVVAGGDVLITAGLYNGSSSGSAEERYAPLNADGSVSSRVVHPALLVSRRQSLIRPAIQSPSLQSLRTTQGLD